MLNFPTACIQPTRAAAQDQWTPCPKFGVEASNRQRHQCLRPHATQLRKLLAKPCFRLQSKGTKKIEQILLLIGRERIEIADDLVGLGART